MKTPILLICGLMASVNLLLAPSAQADTQHLQFTERHGLPHHRSNYYGRPHYLGFTPSEYYHEHPIVIYDEPYFANRGYMGPTIGFTFGFGGHPHEH